MSALGNERSIERSTSSPAPRRDTMFTVGGTTIRCTACGTAPLPGSAPLLGAPFGWLPRWVGAGKVPLDSVMRERCDRLPGSARRIFTVLDIDHANRDHRQ